MIGCEEPVEEEVAVKTMEDEASEEDRVKFLQEAAIMGQFDHPNIVKIMGIMVIEDQVSTHDIVHCYWLLSCMKTSITVPQTHPISKVYVTLTILVEQNCNGTDGERRS